MVLAFQPELRQLAAIFGEISLVFVIGWVCSIAAGLLVNRVSKRHLLVFLSLGVVILFYGGVRVSTGRGMWLQAIDDWPQSVKYGEPAYDADSLQIACVVPYEGLPGQIHDVQEALNLGADIVMFAEGALNYEDPEQFNQQVNYATATSNAPYIAPAYMEQVCGDSECEIYNSMALMNQSGVLFNYRKNRPVPILESETSAGDDPTKPMPLIFEGKNDKLDLVTLNVGLGICFDFDFPYLFRDVAGTDLMLGASRYWSSIGWILWADNVFRAIENGFTLVKCSETGMSGSADPYGRVLASKPTTIGEVYTMQIPVQTHVWTWYRNAGGWLFGWISLGVTPFTAC